MHGNFFLNSIAVKKMKNTDCYSLDKTAFGGDKSICQNCWNITIYTSRLNTKFIQFNMSISNSDVSRKFEIKHVFIEYQVM
jgi:hypothetical protein